MRNSAVPPWIGVDALRAAIGFDDLIEPVGDALAASSAGLAQSGMIVGFPAADPSEGDFYVKSGVLRGHPIFIVKMSPWFAVNAREGSKQGGFIAVFDAKTGRTIALLDEQHYLSDIRTAAAGALAARALAPATVDSALVVGSGVQAYWQPLALHRERPFKTLRIWARDTAKAAALARRVEAALPDVAIETVTNLEAAVQRSDVILTATVSREPLIRGDWLRSGHHLTAVGADDPTKCELDADVLSRAEVFVDSMTATLDNGDVHRAVRSGRYAASQLRGEIGNVLAGRIVGRTHAGQITVAKFVGLGIQDLVAADVSLRKLLPGYDTR